MPRHRDLADLVRIGPPRASGERAEGLNKAQVCVFSSEPVIVSDLRRDIAEAAAKMVVSFGTRSAMRGLPEELGSEERVVELAACSYAGAAGVVALTADRVIAIRDDYSKHQVQDVTLAEVTTLDYDPTVHDGFALFTATGRLVVRKMRREDGDRLVDALLTRAPHILIRVTRPVGTPPVQAPRQLSGLGRHRKPAAARPAEPPRRSSCSTPTRTEPVVAPARASVLPTITASALPAATPTGPPAVVAPAVAAQTTAAQMLSDAVPAQPAMAPEMARAGSAPAAPGLLESSAARPATDKEILVGLLADLHAQGVLTADEFAAKVCLIVTQP